MILTIAIAAAAAVLVYTHVLAYRIGERNEARWWAAKLKEKNP